MKNITLLSLTASALIFAGCGDKAASDDASSAPAASNTAPAAGGTSLTTEINTIAKIISGATGIPIHYLGFTDLMSNRATAEDLAELVNVTTSHEREAWKSGIT
ncbi:MAG: hypothetical protein NWR36_08580, partial [Opitutales bacterium]|nr:hypothetical protein [Opitutales bacterium]